MAFRIGVAWIAALVAVTVTTPAQASPSKLVSFNSCPALLSYARAHATPYVTAYGFGGAVGIKKTATPGVFSATSAGAAADSATAAAPIQGVDYSGTNVQETGVDEPDMVKTNGTTLFTIENGSLESVDVSGGKPKLLDTVVLTNGWGSQLLLSGTHLLVLSRGGYWFEPLPAQTALMIRPVSAASVLTEFDVSDPAHLQLMKTLTIDGSYVDARQIGTTVRVISSASLPIALPLVSPTASMTAGAATTKNKGIVAHSRVKAWLPTYKLGGKAPHALVQCRNVRRPVGFSGLGMLTVTTIDLAKGLDPVNSTGLMTDGRIVYASPTTLYVATEQWASRPQPDSPTVAPDSVSTQISAFDISDPVKTSYIGTGSVTGYLLNQWALSEFQGVLRVVSTDTPAWWGDSGTKDTQSYLTTFRAGDGKLNQVGQLGGLGANERVYAVRFIGNNAFVVTFKQVDPLHTIDISDPAHPKLLGVLTIDGYSAYLHPINDNLLLGIGQDVGANNEPTGTQVSLFDISDLAHPTRVAKASLGQGWSAAESDHHAFLYWQPSNLVVVPFGQLAVGMKVTRSGISELGRIAQLDTRTSQIPQIDRSLVVSGNLLTVSSAGVKASKLSTLADAGWAAFPAAAPLSSPGPIVSSGGGKVAPGGGPITPKSTSSK